MIRHIHLRVRTLDPRADGRLGMELVPLRTDVELPTFEPGWQLELHAPTEKGVEVITAPLLGDASERHRYVLAVDRHALSDPAAWWLDEQLKPGQFLRVSAPRAAEQDQGFKVLLRKSGRQIDIRPSQTILEALLAAGLQVPHSCRSGTCGTCLTRVVAGVPAHRDKILSDADKASKLCMLICCSGSVTPMLELDL